ncbi:hypothetical protein ACOME3_003440 [Neoechinorhynchus agilis]
MGNAGQRRSGSKLRSRQNKGRQVIDLQLMQCRKSIDKTRERPIIRMGQMRPITMEKNEGYHCAFAIAANDLLFSSEKIANEQTKAIYLVQSEQPRKTYSLVLTKYGTYAIGGYLYFEDQRRREIPSNDLRCKDDEIINILPIPGAGIHNGVATDDVWIHFIGGQTLSNKSSNQFLSYRMDNDTWYRRPNFITNVIAPGLLCRQKDIFVLGGFDIICGETCFSGDFSVFSGNDERLVSESIEE